jgi:formiminotetrahydrofolate cyclodeaminase
VTTGGYQTTALGDFLDALSSNDPVPGGGAAAALAGSIGVSLLLMVAGMNKTRPGTPEALTDLAATAARLRPLRDELVELITIDGKAYTQVMAAYRLPKDTDADTAARAEAVAAGLRAATEAPLQTMRVCVQALGEAALVARIGNPNAATDAAVGAQMLLAGLRSAAMNVDVNVKGMSDAAFADAAREQRQALEADGRRLAGAILQES